MPRYAVILPAAGQSTRFGGAEKKPFLDLHGRPIWLRSAELFAHRPDVCQILLVVAPDRRGMFCQCHGAQLDELRVSVADGGAERFESVANALQRVKESADFVAVHDAVRPCVSPDLIDQVFARAAQTGAALLALPVQDTVKRVGEGQRVAVTVPRQGLWLAQTPQVCRRDWLLDAYSRRDELGGIVTDDAQLIEAAGYPVEVVPGSPLNLKITTPIDLALAEVILQTRSTGQGSV